MQDLPMLHAVEYIQVIASTRCKSSIEQSHLPTRKQERSQLGFEKARKTREFLALHARVSNLHQHARTMVPALDRRLKPSKAQLAWRHAVDAAV